MKRKKIILISTILGLLIITAAVFVYIFRNAIFADVLSPTVTIYVSNSGNDLSSGNRNNPYATLDKALAKVRSLRKAGNKSLVDVHLLSGEYNLSSTLKITAAEAGGDTQGIRFIADGTLPIIRGSAPITTAWKACNTASCPKIPAAGLSNVYVSDLSGDTSFKGADFNSLFVNNQRVQRAKSPNSGYFYAASVDSGAKSSFKYKTGDLSAAWSNPKAIDLVYFHSYTQDRMKINSITADTVTFQKETNSPLDQPKDPIYHRYFVENAAEFLDSPGEWFLDKTSSKLYYWPKTGEQIASAKIFAPKVSKLIEIQDAHEVTFTGIRFMMTDFEYGRTDHDPATGIWSFNPLDHTGIPATSADALEASFSPLADVRNSSNVKFSDSYFSLSGGYALRAAGSNNDQIINNHFSDLGAGAIQIGSCSHCAEQGSNSGSFSIYDGTNKAEVLNNTIENFGQVFNSGVGIWVLNVRESKILSNSVKSGNYTGISLGYIWDWNWPEERCGSENTIAYNDISDVMKNNYDGAGIHTIGPEKGTEIHDNYIHDFQNTLPEYFAKINSSVHFPKTFGLYFDSGNNYKKAYNNIIYNTGGGINNHYNSKVPGEMAGASISIYNNIIVNYAANGFQVRLMPRNKVFSNNIIYIMRNPSAPDNKEAAIYGMTAAEVPPTPFSSGKQNYSNNIYFQEGAEAAFAFNHLPDLHNIAWWQNTDNYEKSTDGNNYLTKSGNLDLGSLSVDPQFSNIAKKNFSLLPTSPALKLGAQIINPALIGPAAK